MEFVRDLQQSQWRRSSGGCSFFHDVSGGNVDCLVMVSYGDGLRGAHCRSSMCGAHSIQRSLVLLNMSHT